MNDPRVRPARQSDIPAIVILVRELAAYERLLDECRLTEQQLGDALFTRSPALFAHVAEVAGDVVGCALWFLNFSTWRGVHGIYLEDLYIRPGQRGTGLGRALLQTLAQECVRRGFGRLEWAVLDWNTPAIGFYHSIGAIGMDGWTVFRLAGDSLAELGGG